VIHEVIVRRLAENHLAEAYNWYERQSAGLGASFLHRYAEAQDLIAEFPASAPVVFMDYRRVLLRRFPYGVFYVIESDLVVVAAVYHLARNPQVIQASLPP
jgi:toxin ParE1/3/4